MLLDPTVIDDSCVPLDACADHVCALIWFDLMSPGSMPAMTSLPGYRVDMSAWLQSGVSGNVTKFAIPRVSLGRG